MLQHLSSSACKSDKEVMKRRLGSQVSKTSANNNFRKTKLREKRKRRKAFFRLVLLEQLYKNKLASSIPRSCVKTYTLWPVVMVTTQNSHSQAFIIKAMGL